MAEKGDSKLWQQIAGKAVTLWVPTDASQAVRLLTAFLRSTNPAHRPTEVRMIAPITLYDGAGTLPQILDLWHCPLLSAKWSSSVVQKFTLTATPMEVILPAGQGPRKANVGLAIFHLGHEADRAVPKMLEPFAPIAEFAGSLSATVDAPTQLLPQLMAALQTEAFEGAIVREPRHSCISVEACQRVSLRVIFGPGTTELEALLRLQSLRTLDFGHLVFFGLREMAGASDSLILDFGNSLNFRHYWSLCRQVVFLSPSRALVQTSVEADVWSGVMNDIMARDADDSKAELRYKPSAGGRKVATPGATPAALAAARRGGNRHVTSADCVATVQVAGEAGHEDGTVLHSIMKHLVNSTSLTLQPAANLRAPVAGEYYAATSVDPDARPGCVKVVLEDIAGVHKVYDALHGKSVKIGVDIIGVVVTNDVLDGAAVPGGQLRRR